jgi:hypothetical protein
MYKILTALYSLEYILLDILIYCIAMMIMCHPAVILLTLRTSYLGYKQWTFWPVFIWCSNRRMKRVLPSLNMQSYLLLPGSRSNTFRWNCAHLGQYGLNGNV